MTDKELEQLENELDKAVYDEEMEFIDACEIYNEALEDLNDE